MAMCCLAFGISPKDYWDLTYRERNALIDAYIKRNGGDDD